MLTYTRSDSLHIEGYTDFDYAGDDRKSTSRYIFTLAGGAISWKSSKQTVTTSSTMYAEFVAYTNHSSYTAIIIQQYVMLTTISQVVLSNTLT